MKAGEDLSEKAIRRWTDKEHEELEKLREQGLTINEIARSLTRKFNRKFTFYSVRNRYRRVEKKQKERQQSLEEAAAIPNYKENREILGDGTHKSDKLLRMSEEQSKDKDYILKAHGYDPEEWALVSAKSNIWNAYSKQDGVQVLYSSKITVKPKDDEIDPVKIQRFFERLSQSYQPKIYEPKHYAKNGKMLEVNIADLHLGKLCWIGDSGDQYDEKIANERFFYIIDDTLAKTEGYKFEEILFVWSNDFFHYDTITKTTTAGTPQDTNLRWQQMFELGVEMLVKAIDILSQYAPVKTMYIGSNHDKMFSYFATMFLYAWYRNQPYVTVDNTARARKYIEYGNVLLQLSHGHSEKKRLGKTMQVDMREAWGRTLYHHVHAAHVHSQKETIEDNGVIMTHVSSVTGTDVWHDESGYVGAEKKSQAFIWDKVNGLEHTIYSPIKQYPNREKGGMICTD